MKTALDQFFGISKAGSTVPRELRAGVTTFLTMAYILFVNPSILEKAIPLGGGGFGQHMAATAIAAALGCLAMGLIARYPFATAPGMGLNAFFAYTLVLGHGLPWQTALGCVFLSGLLAVVIGAAGIRESIIKAFPVSLKRATAAGIGLFLAIIGASNAGLVVAHPATLVTIGDVKGGGPLIAGAGLLVTSVLLALKVRGAILFGIIAASVLAIVTGAPVFQGKVFGGFPYGIVQPPAWPVDLAFQMDLGGALSTGLVVTIFTLWFVDFFDTAGTLVGLAERAGFTDAQGNLPRGSKAFVCDGLATTLGAAVGTSSTTTYIESMSGIEDGGRTGLTAVTVAALFLVSLVFWPIAGAVPAAATAPALIIVGAMMMEAAARVAWDDYREAIPAFLTMIMMPLTYSIAHGIAFGIIAYTTIHVLSGKARSLHWIMYGLTTLLIAKFAL